NRQGRQDIADLPSLLGVPLALLAAWRFNPSLTPHASRLAPHVGTELAVGALERAVEVLRLDEAIAEPLQADPVDAHPTAALLHPLQAVLLGGRARFRGRVELLVQQ